MLTATQRYEQAPRLGGETKGIEMTKANAPLPDPLQRDIDGNTILHWALWHKDNETTRKLLNTPVAQALLQQPNINGETPIMWAAKASNTVGIALLVEAMKQTSKDGFDAPQLFSDTRDMDGFTLLIVCAQLDNVGMMEWLWLTGGLFIDERDYLGRTALHWAAYKGHRKAVQWLLSREARLTERDIDGMTPLHLAAMQGQDMIIEILMDVGGVLLLGLSNNNGESPLQLARRNGFGWIYLCMQKARISYNLFGRPYLLHNQYANMFLLAFVLEFAFFSCVLWPWLNTDLWDSLWLHLQALCIMLTILLWAVTCYSDPGWLAEYPLSSQLDECREVMAELSQPVQSLPSSEVPMLPADQGRSAGESRILERSQRSKYDQLWFESTRPSSECSVPHGSHSRGSGAMADVSDRQTNRKLSELRREGVSAEYYQVLCEGRFKQVCVICRVVHGLRSRHCKECRRCIERLDHHCPWIDNCVGLGNQRSFYLFLLVLVVGLAISYYLVFRFISTVTFREGFPPELKVDGLTVLVVLFAAANFLWAGFVLSLFLRQTCFMLLNLTTAEVITKPGYVRRRFAVSRCKYWYLWGFCSLSLPLDILNRLIAYWTLNHSSQDRQVGAQLTTQ